MPPPWPNKLLSSSPNTSRHETSSGSSTLHPNHHHQTNNSATTSIAGGTSPANARSHVSEADILQHAYGIPSLPQNPQSQHGASATASRKSTLERPTTHGRSLSHPFPSLFHGHHHGGGGGKHVKDKKRGGKEDEKKERNLSGVTTTGGFESTDDDYSTLKAGRSAGVASTGTGSRGGGGSKEKVGEKDLMEGKCMTCCSMVRWPRKLNVFRCTVCLTINDLVPVRLEARRGDGQRVPVAGTSSVRGSALSLEKTRQLIDRCMTAYLLERLSHQDTTQSSSDDAGAPSAIPISQSSSTSASKQQISFSEYLSPDSAKSFRSAGRDMACVGDPVSSKGYPSDHRSHLSTPLSTSSPGTFGTHFGPGNGEAYHSQNRQPTGRKSEDVGMESQDHDSNALVKAIFKPLEEYLIHCFGSYEDVNASFSTLRPTLPPRAASEGSNKNIVRSPDLPVHSSRAEAQLSEIDAKTLLMGDIAENGFWWTGEKAEGQGHKGPGRCRTYRGETTKDKTDLVTLKSPRIDWSQLNEWYYLVTNVSRGWRNKLHEIAMSEPAGSQRFSEDELEEMSEHLISAQHRIQRVLLKTIETLLKRPSRPLSEPYELRFLLVILANPLLYPSQSSSRTRDRSVSTPKSRELRLPVRFASAEGKQRTLSASSPSAPAGLPASKSTSGQHSGIIKRILGLLSNVSNECHHHLVSWFARYSDNQFQRLTDLIGSFVTYRLTRQHGKSQEVEHDPTAGLVPNMGGRGESSSAHLHAALGPSSRSQSAKKKETKRPLVVYSDDWQIKAAARVMALVFAANNSGLVKRGDRFGWTIEAGHSAGLAARDRAHRHGQILATSDFYNTLLDYSDLVADFEAWETKRGKFSFCQYPFFLSIWAKIQIMEHDARRQMEVKAREAFFDSIMTKKNVNQYLVLKIRRECLVEDSLKSVSEVVGTGGEEIKKGLRIEFKGEEGIDAGGLRKEWFLLLVRDVFNPEHGMFVYDDDSHFCYFNPNSFETTDQYFLVGVVLGLAIYNSTILDVALPPFAFRKLLAAAPAAAVAGGSHAKPTMSYTLEDLAEYKPVLANGLRQLLDFDGDVETTYCRDFVADVERYGEFSLVPLCPGGETRAVTNANRREFVDLYVRYLLDTAVVRQFEPFKRGFFTVCGGNALSLFRPEEIELLIRGSEEPLDIASLQAVSKNENWGVTNPPETEPVIRWFWDSFKFASAKDQRKLLSFITGSDRIPATGTANLVIKLSCLGDDSPRFPVARTCFNQLSLWRYSSREKLERMLWWAVNESEGFGLK